MYATISGESNTLMSPISPITNLPTPSILLTLVSRMYFPSFSVTSGIARGNSSQRRFLALRVISSRTCVWVLPCMRKASR